MDNLEQRVQILEQELEILKNQIQATLLDIQEQLLTNAYPSLRSDDANNDGGYRGGGGMPAPRNDGPQMGQEGFANVRRVTFDDTGDAFETIDPPPQAQVLPEPPRPVVQPQSPRPVVQAPAPPLEVEEEEGATLAELEAWATEKVEEMGPRRTRKLIEMHYRKGHFDDEAREILLDLIALYDEESATSNSRQTPVVQPRPASPQPAPKPERQERPAPRKQARRAPQPVVDPEPTQPTPPPDEVADDEDEDQQHLVLRLIAGVQNAGAGMSRRKKNG